MDKRVTRELENFFKKFRFFPYKKGEAILRAGDSPQGVFYLKKGYVRIYAISEEGEELTQLIFRPGDPFALVWAISSLPNPYNFEALTEVELWRCPREEFIAFLKARPEISYELIKRLLIQFRGTLIRMEQLVFGDAYAKVASIVFLLAKRLGKKSKKGTIIQIPLTHKDVGSLVGLTRETTSIEMKRLERKNLIEYNRGMVVVKNINRLRKESSITESHY